MLYVAMDSRIEVGAEPVARYWSKLLLQRANVGDYGINVLRR
jgi:hypothetical protein